MKSAVLARLQRLLGAASAAEAARLAGVLAQTARCRGRAARLRGEIGGPAGQPGPGAGPLVAPELSAAELAAVLRWDLRLAERARAEDARAGALEVEAAALRPRLARAVGGSVCTGTPAVSARARIARAISSTPLARQTGAEPAWRGHFSATA